MSSIFDKYVLTLGQASQIGLSLAISGVISCAMQIILLPILLYRIPATKLYNICMFTWCLTFMSLPLLNLLARSDLAAGLWCGVVTILLISRFGWLAFSYVLSNLSSSSLTTSQYKHDFGAAQYRQFGIGISKRACSIRDVCISGYQPRFYQLGICAFYGAQARRRVLMGWDHGFHLPGGDLSHFTHSGLTQVNCLPLH
jgi:hypothetical protein